MPSKTKEKIYCSLDIETSGFDPLKNEILEVGFVFFELGEKGIKITKEWTSVFKPKRAVPANILGLTGITMAELENAPEFSEYRDFLQESLGNAVIVGHNVIFDIKFLEGVGVKFSGEVLDTLDLVQFLLPTHHSYNLENLMHTFGIVHKDAHRALADSKAALLVLEKMLRLYSSYPQELKDQNFKLMSEYQMPFTELFAVALKPEVLPVEKKLKPAIAAKASFTLKPKRIYALPLGKNPVFDMAEALAGSKDKMLLVVPKVQQVMAFWKQGRVSQVLFSPEVQFNNVKFSALLRKKTLSPEQVRFALKILVWKHTNWQTESILDLNLSFFGGQFKQLIAGGKFPNRLGPSLACCDHQTFLLLSQQKLFKNRFVVISGLSEFEQHASSNISTKVSWGYVSYLLKSVYNSELNTGNKSQKQAVEQGLIASDLFFGLVSALLQSDPPGFLYYRVTPESEYSTQFQKIKQAAESFVEKLKHLNQTLKLGELDRYAESLAGFFENQPNSVKWIELAENRCTFFSTPLNITHLVSKIIFPYKQLSFADALGTEKLFRYFVTRLGLESFSIEPLSIVQAKTEMVQGDLFTAARALLPFGKKPNSPKVICHYKAQDLPAEEIIKILGSKDLPAAVLFGGQLQVKQFYEKYYQQLNKRAALFSQTVSGGGNKIFRNFSIHKNSLLLCTDKFIVKQTQSQTAVEPVEFLAVKTLIICHLPFEQFTHPYQEALSSQYAKPFEDFSLPKAVYNFHSLLKFFTSPKLENIYLYDIKLGKSYAQAFKDYLKQLPGIELQEN